MCLRMHEQLVNRILYWSRNKRALFCVCVCVTILINQSQLIAQLFNKTKYLATLLNEVNVFDGQL